MCARLSGINARSRVFRILGWMTSQGYYLLYAKKSSSKKISFLLQGYTNCRLETQGTFYEQLDTLLMKKFGIHNQSMKNSACNQNKISSGVC